MASTAELLRDQMGLENPFDDASDEEVTEETVEDESEELEDEVDETEDESEDETEDESEDDTDDDEYEKLSKISENFKRAFQEERTLRQEAQAEIDDMRKSKELLQQAADDAEAELESIMEQLKELELDDLVKVKGKTDPKVRELMREKEQRKQQEESAKQIEEFNKKMVSNATTLAPDFNNVDLQNSDHGIILQNMIYMNAMSGMDVEEAVKDAMSRLDSVLGTTLKKRTPPVKPKRKLKAVSKTTKSTKSLSKEERIRAALEKAGIT